MPNIKPVSDLRNYTEELCNEQAAAGTVARITKRIRMLANFLKAALRFPLS